MSWAEEEARAVVEVAEKEGGSLRMEEGGYTYRKVTPVSR